MTNIRVREEVITRITAKFLNGFDECVMEFNGRKDELDAHEEENISLIEVIVACGTLQTILYKRGYNTGEDETKYK